MILAPALLVESVTPSWRKKVKSRGVAENRRTLAETLNAPQQRWYVVCCSCSSTALLITAAAVVAPKLSIRPSVRLYRLHLNINSKSTKYVTRDVAQKSQELLLAVKAV